MSRQSVKVHIFNQAYSLLADDDPREIEELAQQIDHLMVSIAERSSTVDSTRVAVLACLHLADQLRVAERRVKSFENQSARIGSLLEEALGS